MNKDCFFCGGFGYWEDQDGKKTLYCPICHPHKAEHQSLSRVNLSTWFPDAWPTLEARYYGPRFQKIPWLLVLHSGSRSPNVAEFFNKIGNVHYKIKNRWVKVSAHIAWSGKQKRFIQCVPFSHVAWHCGGSRLGENRLLNFCSIGIELPGPWDKPRDGELYLLRDTVETILNILPIKVAVRHSDIDPRKKDPGPGFDWGCLRGIGLELPFA